jgi:hypothetical protein
VSEPKLADVALFWRKQGETDFGSGCTVRLKYLYIRWGDDACAKSSRLFYEEQL